MNAVALINEFNNAQSNQWQFDRVMSAIAYDMDLKVVFMPNSILQLTQNMAWKSLKIYGVDDIYFLNSGDFENHDLLLNAQGVDSEQLKNFIQKADIVL